MPVAHALPFGLYASGASLLRPASDASLPYSASYASFRMEANSVWVSSASLELANASATEHEVAVK